MSTTLPVQQLYESPTNPRKILGDTSGIEDSIKKHGILQALLVRENPQNGHSHEVVLGSRRLRAATKLKLAEVPVDIRVMTDAQVIEAQLVENLQRDDLHPLDEADGYKTLTDGGMSTEEVAAKVGKELGYVYKRLKLCSLGKPARKAFLEDKITPGVALVVARIPNAGLQERAVKDVLQPAYGGGPMSASRASAHIQHNYMLRLADAPFKVGDAELVPSAGSCTDCHLRTGSAPMLFDDIDDKDDMCTDPGCYRGKCDAAWAKRKAEAEAAKLVIITKKKDVKEMFPHGNHLSSREYVDLRAKCWDDPKGRTYRSLLGKGAATAVVQAPSGAIVELVAKKGLTKALKDAGHKFKAKTTATTRTSGPKKSKADKAKAELEVKARDTAIPRVIEQLVERFEKVALTEACWLTLATWAVDSDGAMPALERRGMPMYGKPAEKALKKLSKPQLQGFVFEVLMPEIFELDSTTTRATCKEFSVDPKKVLKDVMRELEAPADAKADKKGKAAKKPAKKKPAKKKPAAKSKKKVAKAKPKKAAKKKAAKKKARKR